MVGANVTLTNLLKFFQDHQADPSVSAYFPDFAAHMKEVGSNSMRSVSRVLRAA